MGKRLTAILLTLVLIISISPLNAFALSEKANVTIEEEQTELLIGSAEKREIRYIDEQINIPKKFSQSFNSSKSGSTLSIADSSNKYAYYDFEKRSNSSGRQALYDDILEAATNFYNFNSDVIENSGFYILTVLDLNEYGLTETEAVEVYYMFRADQPLFYFLSNELAFGGNCMYVLVYNEYASTTARQTTNEAISSKISEYLDAIKDCTDDYEKAVAIKDKLYEEMEYAFEDDGVTPSNEAWAHNVVGGLTKGFGVCESYAKTYQLILNYAGINNVLVVGKALGGNHAWNLVEIEDNFYWVDCTWGDSSFDKLYFLKGDNDFSDHEPFPDTGTGTDFQYALPTVSPTSYERILEKNITVETALLYKGMELLDDDITLVIKEGKDVTTVPYSDLTITGLDVNIVGWQNVTVSDGTNEVTQKIYIHDTKRVDLTDVYESPHDIMGYYMTGFGLTKENALFIGIHFTEDTFVTPNDASYISVEGVEYKGDELADKEIVVRGNSITINISSQVDTHDYGYCIDREWYIRPVHCYEIKTVSPTCTEQGYQYYECAACGAITEMADSETNPLGHAYGAWTKLDNNQHQRVCTNDPSHIETANHNWNSGVVTKAATCTTAGVKTYTCEDCGATKTSTINAKGHSYSTSFTVDKKATLSAAGSMSKHCKNCGAKTNITAIPKVSTVKLSATSYTYDGKAKKPTVTVTDSKGNTLKSGTDYKVTYASGRTKAGTYKVTVTGIGNYDFTKTLTFTINPITKTPTVKLSATSYTYDGNAKKPTVTVTDAKGNKLVSGTDYTVTYASGRKAVGTYKVTVKGKGNYSFTKELTFKINPAKTSIKSLTAGSKAFTVKWTKKTTQVTGYQIQYSTSSDFSSAKTVTVTKNSTVSKKISSLKAKKKYYVRIRTYKTVDGTKYYSAWSDKKSVTTKK